MQDCISCKRKDCDLYKGVRFLCHEESVQNQKEHNQLCYACACGEDDSIVCPIHMGNYYIDYELYLMEPVQATKPLAKVESKQQVKGVSAY